MKIKIIDAEEMGVKRRYSNGDIVEVEYDVDDEVYQDMEEPYVYLADWEGEYFEFVEKQSTGWDGKGLPPIGTVCEILGTASGSWSEGVIDYIDGKHCVWHWVDGSQETMHNRVCAMQFRPLKSEKQKEIDKIASELLESVNKNGDDFVHLEWEIAEHLYNAGLRFTEDSK